MGLVQRWRDSTRFQDVTAAAATFAAGLVLNLVGLTGVWPMPQVGHLASAGVWWHTAPLVAGCLAMLGKRRRPMVALGIGVLAVLADLALGGSVALVLVLFDLLFSAGQFASARARTAVTTAVFVLIGTAGVVGGLASGELRIAVFIALQLVTLLFVPLWWAANMRQQRTLGELTAETTAREAVLAERAAMARDLHDVIAAHLSTTAIHSGAALSRPPDATRDRAALRAVRTSSLAALEDMRSMIMLLRADGAEELAPGGLDRLPELVEAAAGDGLRVDVRTAEIPHMPVLVAQATYRIVREALTNARKHAPASHVRLEVREAGARVSVSVTNTLTVANLSAVSDTAAGGSTPTEEKGGNGLGHRALSAGTGLASMRERAALLGGELTAGPDGGLWRVSAHLPLHPEVPA